MSKQETERNWISITFADSSIPQRKQWGQARDVASVKKYWQSQVVCGVVVEFEGKASVDVLALILEPEKVNPLQRILE
jgi:hypothetical protein